MSLQAKRYSKHNRNQDITGSNRFMREVRPLVTKIREIPKTQIIPHRLDRTGLKDGRSRRVIQVVMKHSDLVGLLVQTLTGSQRIDVKTNRPEEVVELCNFEASFYQLPDPA